MDNLSIEEKLIQKINHVSHLIKELKPLKDSKERFKVLYQTEQVKSFFATYPFFEREFKRLEELDQWIVLSLIAIDQGNLICQSQCHHKQLLKNLQAISMSLRSVEEFYRDIGGMIGYYSVCLDLILRGMNAKCSSSKTERFLEPSGYSLKTDCDELRLAIRKGIEGLKEIAEIYPVGGAGDRLNLHDENTGEPLPAAMLQFQGMTLLEGLIKDLQAREYLYYKLSGEQLHTPVALMTSVEKNNEAHVRKIFEGHQWFGRPAANYLFFIQPMVPLVTEEGDLAVCEPFKLMFKPGGHGVMWKLAEDRGIIAELDKRRYSKALVRQINNPIAGLDHGVLGFTGIGLLYDKVFGFASCQRVVNTAEGMNVLIETKTEDGFNYAISNIEYTDFVHKGIKDHPCRPGVSYSVFPANTNVLFADLKEVVKVLKENPFPGMLMNMKTEVTCLNDSGETKHVKAGRLETLMQNLADTIYDTFDSPQPSIEPKYLRTYLTDNERMKTISVTKKSYKGGDDIQETPEGAFFDLLKNYENLLRDHCQFTLPAELTQELYLQEGPAFISYFNPALGPLFPVIGQKIRKGSLSSGAEFRVHATEVDLENLNIQGSFLIDCHAPLGQKNDRGEIIYSEYCGRCQLKNIQIVNQGYNRQSAQPLWKQAPEHHEACRIILEGFSEFEAQDCRFEGNLEFRVPHGKKLTVRQIEGKLVEELQTLKEPSWKWQYAFNDLNYIVLNKAIA